MLGLIDCTQGYPVFAEFVVETKHRHIKYRSNEATETLYMA